MACSNAQSCKNSRYRYNKSEAPPAPRDEVIEMKTSESKVYSFQLTRSKLEDEFWDDEATKRQFDVVLLLELVALQVIVGPFSQAVEAASKLLLASRDIHVVLPAKSSVPEPLARFWGLLISGELAYARAGKSWRFYERCEASGWVLFDPLEFSVPGLEWRGLQQAAWLASKLQAGVRIVEESFAIDGQVLEAASAGGWETLQPVTPAGEPLINVTTPEDASARLQLLASAWGEPQTEFMAQVSFYLAAPLTPKHFFLLADEGGTGKSSFEKAFTAAFPSIATLGLDADNLASAGFTGGAALVPLIGKRVAFADESGELGDRTMKAIAGLTTGISKQVRYGGGRIGFESFSLKLMFASNQAESFSPIEAVGRRKVEVPELQLKPASWWQEPAGEAWPGATRWQVCFSRETIFALVSRGWQLWQQNRGQWPAAKSGSSVRKVSAELQDRILSTLLVTARTASGVWPLLWSTFIGKGDLTERESKALKTEAMRVAGLTQKLASVGGKKGRYVAVADESKWAAVSLPLEQQAAKLEAEAKQQRAELKAKEEDPAEREARHQAWLKQVMEQKDPDLW